MMESDEIRDRVKRIVAHHDNYYAWSLLFDLQFLIDDVIGQKSQTESLSAAIADFATITLTFMEEVSNGGKRVLAGESLFPTPKWVVDFNKRRWLIFGNPWSCEITNPAEYWGGNRGNPFCGFEGHCILRPNCGPEEWSKQIMGDDRSWGLLSPVAEISNGSAVHNTPWPERWIAHFKHHEPVLCAPGGLP